jgi:hypothetical protein
MFGYFSSPDLRKGNKGAEPVLLSSVSWNSELKGGAYPSHTKNLQKNLKKKKNSCKFLTSKVGK